jgi:hypothetical protein
LVLMKVQSLWDMQRPVRDGVKDWRTGGELGLRQGCLSREGWAATRWHRFVSFTRRAWVRDGRQGKRRWRWAAAQLAWKGCAKDEGLVRLWADWRVWGCRGGGGRYMAGRPRVGWPRFGVVDNGAVCSGQCAWRGGARGWERGHCNGSQSDKKQVRRAASSEQRAAGDVRDVDARRRSARMCLEASLADVPSSEHGGESGSLARTSQSSLGMRSASWGAGAEHRRRHSGGRQAGWVT